MTTIITLNWNAGALTAALLDSLRELRGAFRVIVADNGSTDGSPESLRRAYPEADFLLLGVNRGFGAGNNAAIARALAQGAETIWLLNNDTRVSPDALAALHRALARDSRIGAAGSLLRDMTAPHRVQMAGGGRVVLPLAMIRPARRGATPDYLSGTSLLLRAAALRDSGMFDEGFFLYWEDTDLGYRLRRAGWCLAVAEDSVIYHAGSATTRREPGARSAHSLRGYARFLGRHAPRRARAWTCSAALFQATLKMARGQVAAARGCLRGGRDGVAFLNSPAGRAWLAQGAPHIAQFETAQEPAAENRDQQEQPPPQGDDHGAGRRT